MQRCVVALYKKGVGMISLHLKSTVIQSGSMEVSWCVSHDLLDAIVAKKIAKPYLLLIVSHIDKDYSYDNKPPESRVLVPLNDLSTYVAFTRQGVNRITGLLVFQAMRTLPDDFFLSKSDGRYNSDVLSPKDGTLYAPTSVNWSQQFLLGGWECNLEQVSGSIDVEVPWYVFAKKPLDYKWVNLWFPRPKDQCNLRGRRFVAYTIQPVVILVFLLLLVVYQIVTRVIVTSITILLGGLKKLNPFQHNIEDIVNKAEYVFWPASWPLWARVCCVPFTPFIVLLISAIVLTLGSSATGIIGWTLLSCVIFALIAASTVIFIEAARANREFPRTKKNMWYENTEKQTVLLCDGDASARAKHRPIRLRYHDVKAKICKPFAS